MGHGCRSFCAITQRWFQFHNFLINIADIVANDHLKLSTSLHDGDNAVQGFNFFLWVLLVLIPLT